MYNVMGVFADDVMERSSLIMWCNFTFCSYLCGYAIMMLYAVTVCFIIWLFACLLVVNACLEESSAAAAEGWRKQTDGDRSSKRQYFIYQQLCVTPW